MCNQWRGYEKSSSNVVIHPEIEVNITSIFNQFDYFSQYITGVILSISLG